MRVSITIPCRNEKKYIGKCLQSIVDCNYDKSLLNVYVCDGLSDDGTQEIIQTFATHHPFIHLINNLQKTTPQALNLGIKADDSDLKIRRNQITEIKRSNCDSKSKQISVQSRLIFLVITD
jgi:glycosyltransferase involved in cell wall biosynthesis